MTAISLRLCIVVSFSALAMAAGSPFALTFHPGASRTEPMGQSSRRTSLVISEIMFHPAARSDGKNTEFIELFNTLSTPEDLSGWHLEGAADFVFPPGTVIPGEGFVVVAAVPEDLKAAYDVEQLLGPFENQDNLPNNRGEVRLRNRIGAVFLDARYDTDPPWPAAADGAGHSLVLARPSYGEAQAKAWAASHSIGGSPGRFDPTSSDPLDHLVINEILSHSSEVGEGFIELYNHSNQPLNISGCVLTDSRGASFSIGSGTFLPAGGFAVFREAQLGFSLEPGGETIFLRNPANTRVLDAVRSRAQALDLPLGRSPDGAPVLSELRGATPGIQNEPPLIRDLVINEIMYHPISGDAGDEYVELHNRGSAAVDLAGWRLEGGIEFTFPSPTPIPADGFVVLARDPSRLMAHYPHLTKTSVHGPYRGRLSNGGERIALNMPDPVVVAGAHGITTQTNYVVVDEVTYGDGGRWGNWSDGGGSSLELIDPRSDNRLAANWADSDESAKAPWTTLSVPGVLDHGTSRADQLQVLLLGRGECLIDDVEVLNQSGINLVANFNFETGGSGWTAEGTHAPSAWEPGEGFASDHSYRLRTTDRGDNQVNRLRTGLRSSLPPNSTATIGAKFRWLRGHPEILFRLRGNALEAAGTMELPRNLGTPGLPNSRAQGNAAPAIYDVSHFPAVPAADEPVVVTARMDDPDGLGSPQIRYRVDPSPELIDLPLRDDGTGGDALGGDGLYSATLPGQPRGILLAFHIQATDALNATALFPNDAPDRECLVRFGEEVPSGSFPSYRLWMTQATFNDWRSRHKLDNRLNDLTFVLGNHRIIYNAGATFAGSPYIAPSFNTPSGRLCGYTIEFPSDEPFLGDDGLVLDWPGGHGNETTAIQEQMAYWIADQVDLPFSHRYFIRLTVNGVTDMQRGGVFEAVLQPGAEFIRQWSPSQTDGDFFKIERAFEFSDSGSRIADPEPQLRVYITPDLVHGGTKKKTEKYRWYWVKRAYDRAHDYTSLFAVVDALNAAAPEPYTSATESLVDVEEWMGIFAVEHIINNFDSWGHEIGKNMYHFIPRGGRSQLYMFDLDWLMLVSTSHGYSASSGPLFTSDDPTVARMYNHPAFRRAYFRAVQRALEDAFVPAKYEPVMDAKYEALRSNGITRCDGQTLTNPNAVKRWFAQRREFLAAQLAKVSAEFAITSNGGHDFTSDAGVISLTGTAPVEVFGLRVNGLPRRVTWTDVTSWSVDIPLVAGENSLIIEGYDSSGVRLAQHFDTVRVTSAATGEPLIRLVINEWMADGSDSFPDPADGNADDWFELYNPGPAMVDLTGYSLSDRLDDPSARWQIPAGTTIPGGRFLLVWADEDLEQNAPGTRALHAGFKLNRDGESIALFRPDGVVVDSVRFGTQTTGISQGRLPDGGAELEFMSQPTPGSANTSGALKIEVVSAPGGMLKITWNSQPGGTYRVQSTESLDPPIWADAFTVTAVSAAESAIVDRQALRQRYFRVQWVTP